MIYKLNNLAPLQQPGKCLLHLETSNNELPLNVPDLKTQVSHYTSVLKDTFNIPDNVFFNNIPININHILTFINKNGAELAGVRIYFAKKSNDASLDDYELIFVPCREVKDNLGEVLYYQDMLNPSGLEINDSYVITTECRKPPGCSAGAALNP
jgi:hypothetical protein